MITRVTGWCARVRDFFVDIVDALGVVKDVLMEKYLGIGFK